MIILDNYLFQVFTSNKNKKKIFKNNKIIIKLIFLILFENCPLVQRPNSQKHPALY